MSIKQYNKLVRDRIPEIIEASGKNCVTEILSDADYLKMLDAKLDEELAEYHKDQTVEELADLLEVIFAAATARGCELEQLEHIRREKARKRGTFEKKILLKKVIDPSGDENIVSKIVRNQSAILEKMDEKVLSSYFWLMDNLHTRNIAADEEYRRRFGGYYRMRFVSEKYRDAFFELFEQIKEQPEFSFCEAAYRLFEVDGKHEFSFITKMLHTIDPSRPIYDSQVDAALKLRRTYQPDLGKKLQQDDAILARLSSVYRELSEAQELSGLMSIMDNVVPGRTMAVSKKIDFILWALGGL